MDRNCFWLLSLTSPVRRLVCGWRTGGMPSPRDFPLARLRRAISFCYICKVLVGPRTPYLGHDVQTATPLVARDARKTLMRNNMLLRRGAVAGCIEGATEEKTSESGAVHQPYRVSQFQVPGRQSGSL